MSNDSDLSDEMATENSWTETSRRRSFSESSLCDVSFVSLENTRPLTPDMKKCMMPVKRTSRLSKYLITPTPPTKCKVSNARPKSSGRVLTSAKSIELLEEKEQKKQEKIREKEIRKRLREEKKKSLR